MSAFDNLLQWRFNIGDASTGSWRRGQKARQHVAPSLTEQQTEKRTAKNGVLQELAGGGHVKPATLNRFVQHFRDQMKSRPT
jgi:hypothetical protein